MSELEELKDAAMAYYEQVWCPVDEPKDSDKWRSALVVAAIKYGRAVSEKKVETRNVNRNADTTRTSTDNRPSSVL